MTLPGGVDEGVGSVVTLVNDDVAWCVGLKCSGCGGGAGALCMGMGGLEITIVVVIVVDIPMAIVHVVIIVTGGDATWDMERGDGGCGQMAGGVTIESCRSLRVFTNITRGGGDAEGDDGGRLLMLAESAREERCCGGV